MDEKIKNFITTFTQDILGNLDIKCEKEAVQWRFVLFPCEFLTEVLTEENGRFLLAIQHLIRTSVHQKFPEYQYHFILDLPNFRKSRENQIAEFIPTLINDVVIKKGKTIVFKSLSGYERLLIHTELKGIRGVQTMSFGLNAERKLVILPTSEMGTLGLENSVVLSLEILAKFLEDEKKSQ